MPTSTRERCLVGVQRIQHNTHVFSVSRKCAHEEPARPAAMDVSVGEADGHNTWELHVAVEVPLLERDLPGRHQACLVSVHVVCGEAAVRDVLVSVEGCIRCGGVEHFDSDGQNHPQYRG